jgi:hypothetical protein
MRVPEYGADRNVKVWCVDQAPPMLRRLADGNATWIAVVPASLLCSGVEDLLVRWESAEHPVMRLQLYDGSLMFSGSRPQMRTGRSVW